MLRILLALGGASAEHVDMEILKPRDNSQGLSKIAGGRYGMSTHPEIFSVDIVGRDVYIKDMNQNYLGLVPELGLNPVDSPSFWNLKKSHSGVSGAADTFQLKNGSLCLEADGSGTYAVYCNIRNPRQLFKTNIIGGSARPMVVPEGNIIASSEIETIVEEPPIIHPRRVLKRHMPDLSPMDVRVKPSKERKISIEESDVFDIRVSKPSKKKLFAVDTDNPHIIRSRPKYVRARKASVRRTTAPRAVSVVEELPINDLLPAILNESLSKKPANKKRRKGRKAAEPNSNEDSSFEPDADSKTGYSENKLEPSEGRAPRRTAWDGDSQDDSASQFASPQQRRKKSAWNRPGGRSRRKFRSMDQDDDKDAARKHSNFISSDRQSSAEEFGAGSSDGNQELNAEAENDRDFKTSNRKRARPRKIPSQKSNSRGRSWNQTSSSSYGSRNGKSSISADYKIQPGDIKKLKKLITKLNSFQQFDETQMSPDNMRPRPYASSTGPYGDQSRMNALSAQNSRSVQQQQGNMQMNQMGGSSGHANNMNRMGTAGQGVQNQAVGSAMPGQSAGASLLSSNSQATDRMAQRQQAHRDKKGGQVADNDDDDMGEVEKLWMSFNVSVDGNGRDKDEVSKALMDMKKIAKKAYQSIQDDRDELNKESGAQPDDFGTKRFRNSENSMNGNESIRDGNGARNGSSANHGLDVRNVQNMEVHVNDSAKH